MDKFEAKEELGRWDYEFRDFLKKHLQLNESQMKKLREAPIWENSDFSLYKPTPRTKSIWIRLTVVLYPLVILLLLLGLPLNYLFTGMWDIIN